MNLFRFGDYQFDSNNGELFLDSKSIHLRHKTALVLQVLLENRARIVTKDELLDHVWKDTVVGDKSLVQAIQELRKLLSDSPQKARFIKTYPKRGYQWVCPVVEGATASAAQVKNLSDSRKPPISTWGLWALGSVTLLVGLGLAWRFSQGNSEHPNSTPENVQVRIAVLPFENRTNDPSLQWLELGLSQMLETTLSRKEGIQIVPYLSLLEQNPSMEMDQIGSFLTAAALHNALAVQIGKDPNGFRVQYCLIDQTGRGELLQFTVPELLASLPLLADGVTEALGLDKGPNLPGYSLVADANQDYAKGLQAMKGQGMALAKSYFEAALFHDPEFGAAKLALAEVLSAQGSLEASAALYNELVNRGAKNSKTPPIQAHFGLARVLIDQGEISQAEDRAKKGLSLAEKINDTSSRALGFRILGTIQDILGASKKRRDLFAQAYEITGGRRDPESQAENLYYLGYWNGPGEDLVKNRNLLEMAKIHFEALGNRRELASSLLALGHNLSVPAQERETYFLQCLNLYVEHGDEAGVLDAQTGLAIFHLSQLQGAKAAEILELACDRAEIQGARLDQALLTYMMAIARLYQYRENPDSVSLLGESRTWMAKSRKLYQQMGIQMRAAAAEMFMGLADHYQGNSDQAIRQVRRSLAVLETMENEELGSMAKVLLATLYMDRQQWQEALPLLEKALDNYKDRTLMVLKYQARCHYELHRYREARTTMEQAKVLAKGGWREEEVKRMQIYRNGKPLSDHLDLGPEPGFLVTYWDVR